RMYLLRDGSLIKVTKDHSFVGFLEDSGRLSEKEAMQHPKRNEINKALGFDGIRLEDDYIETGFSPFLPGDVLLLCSDGLTDMVNNKDITDILLPDSSLKEKGEALINEANKAGGKDNITVVLVNNNKKSLKQKATKPITLKKKESLHRPTETIVETGPIDQLTEKKRSHTTALILLSLLCLLLAGSTYWFWKQRPGQAVQPVNMVQKKSRYEDEKKFTDSLAIAQRIFKVTDSVFGKNIVVSDTIFIRQDSLRIVGNGITLLKDSSYNGPAFFVTANCKYLLLENISFKDFSTAVVMQGKGLQLKKVVFQNAVVPVQHNLMLPLNDTLNGIVRDSFLIKKDTTHK
ncbi:MAG: hypothetical protein M3Y85_02120, partial [Bacteroidota bacterium]|nr:hypothetical protein [Bacteroidota bacterium]